MINKIIHQIWLGNPMPNRLKKYCQSWKEHHPDWEYKLWTEENLPELQNQELYDNAKTYAERSDIIRLEILKKYGGIYVDCDIECKHNIEYLIGDSEFIVCQDLPEWPRFKIPYLNNALMGCTPNHPLIKRLIDELPEHCNEYSNEHVVFRTGPGFLSLRLSGEDVNRIEHGVKIRGERVFIHRYQNTWVNVEPQPRNFWK
jgi:mannosyltransferase OCH1-like enzyme